MSASISPQIDSSWLYVLQDEFQKPYFTAIKQYLLSAKEKNQTIYPPWPLIFNAFNTTSFDSVKVVILGQDPYHGPGQAHGLSFSVPDGIKAPPSLVNIFKEIHDDLWLPIPQSGNFTKRAQQGVFLLNAMLTVQANSPASHKDIGWHYFTDAVIRILSEKKTGLVFLLRGAFAQSKFPLIDTSKHTVLMAAHPSPFSVHKGFFGCKHFSQTNTILSRQWQSIIDRSI